MAKEGVNMDFRGVLVRSEIIHYGYPQRYMPHIRAYGGTSCILQLPLKFGKTLRQYKAVLVPNSDVSGIYIETYLRMEEQPLEFEKLWHVTSAMGSYVEYTHNLSFHRIARNCSIADEHNTVTGSYCRSLHLWLQDLLPEFEDVDRLDGSTENLINTTLTEAARQFDKLIYPNAE